MTDYGRVDLLWLDGDWVKIDMAPVARMARAQQPGLIMVDRNGAPDYMNYLTPEQKIPAHYMPVPWESCITMGNSWSYDPQEKYKPVRRLVQMLVDVVAKNGNLLLDVGPSPEGEWSDTVYRRLAGIGDWLKVNGASIYGTRPLAPYRQGPWAYTQGNGAVYATYLPAADEDKLPAQVSLPASMVGDRAKVRLLGEKGSLKWRRAGDAVEVRVPAAVREGMAGQPAWVIKISL